MSQELADLSFVSQSPWGLTFTIFAMGSVLPHLCMHHQRPPSLGSCLKMGWGSGVVQANTGYPSAGSNAGCWPLRQALSSLPSPLPITKPLLESSDAVSPGRCSACFVFRQKELLQGGGCPGGQGHTPAPPAPPFCLNSVWLQGFAWWFGG